MLETYLFLGFIWANYTLSKLPSLRKSQQEHWFPIVLFSVTLWPFFMYFNYERGELFKK
jgi:hypothetical protein